MLRGTLFSRKIKQELARNSITENVRKWLMEIGTKIWWKQEFIIRKVTSRKMSEILIMQNVMGKYVWPHGHNILLSQWGFLSHSPPHSHTPRGLPTVPPSQRLEMQIPFSLGPSAVLFYYPSEGVWVIVPHSPTPRGLPTVPPSQCIVMRVCA